MSQTTKRALAQSLKKLLQTKPLSKITINDIARHVFLTPDYLNRIIKKETGTSAQEYILVKTMAVAKELLADPSKSISDVAYALGYQYPQYFS